MLDKDLFKRQMERLAVLYPNWNINITDSEVMKIWYNQFKDYDSKYFVKMVDKYISESKYPPTVAGLKEYYHGPLKATVDYNEVDKYVKQVTED